MNVSPAFDNTVERDAIIDPLFEKVVGSGMSTQPDESYMKMELDALIVRLATRHAGDGATDTQNIVKATCAAALGSAAVLVQ